MDQWGFEGPSSGHVPATPARDTLYENDCVQYARQTDGSRDKVILRFVASNLLQRIFYHILNQKTTWMDSQSLVNYCQFICYGYGRCFEAHNITAVSTKSCQG